MPHLAEKIKLFFALAPVYTFHHVRGPVLKLAFLPDLLLKVQEVLVGCYSQNLGTFGSFSPLRCHCALNLHLLWVLELLTPFLTFPHALAGTVWNQRAGSGAENGEGAAG